MTNQDKIRSIAEKYEGQLNLRKIAIFLCSMINVFGYDPKKMRYSIGQRLRFYVIFNWIREETNLFSTENSNSSQTLLISPSKEWKFIEDLLYEFQERQKTRKIRDETVKRDLEVYFLSNDESKIAEFQVRVLIDEEERQKSISKIKRTLNQGNSLTRNLKTQLILTLEYLQNKPFEQLFIGITTELTKDETIKLKKYTPNRVFQNDFDKINKVVKVISKLYANSIVELALKNGYFLIESGGLISPQYFNYIFERNSLIKEFNQEGLSESDYVCLFDFYLCPFIEIENEVHSSPGLLEMFLQYLNYFSIRAKLNNSKMNPFAEKCFNLLKPLENRGILLEYDKFPQQQIDILLFYPDTKELLLIECKDWAPLYVAFIEERKIEIQKETKTQLDKKLQFINEHRDEIKNLFRTSSSDFRISLVGISKIKCENYENVRFFAAYELEEHPELILG